MKTITLITTLVIIVTIVHAQETQSPIQEKMAQLKHLEGNWSGSGWVSMPDGTRSQFDQTENIVSKLDGTVLLIEGIGKNKGSDEVVFNAIAIFTYNTEKEKYDIQSYLASGESTSAEGFFEGNDFIWSFNTPKGMVRYTLTSNETSWNEFGEFSRDGNQWYKFMEMSLSKDSVNN